MIDTVDNSLTEELKKYLNHHYDYYKTRLIDQNLLQQKQIVSYTLSIPVGISRQLGSTDAYTLELAYQVVNKLSQFPNQFPNLRITQSYLYNQNKEKVAAYYTIFYGLPLSENEIATLTTKQLGELFGYKKELIF